MAERLLHFVYGLRPQEEPFSLVHHLAVASAIEVLRPERVLLHIGELPYGFYWDLLRPHIEVHRIRPLDASVLPPAAEPLIDRYRYAHHADVVRLDALLSHGGAYLDIDTLTLQPFPEQWWTADFVIGREAPFAATAPPTLLNAVLLARPHARFAAVWRERVIGAMDGTWAAHSCELAERLSRELPDDVLVLPSAAFARFGPVPTDLACLLSDATEPDADAALLDGVHVLHLCAHLWWDEDRRDFLSLRGFDIDEAWVRRGTSVYARAAQRFLPEHGLLR